MSENQPAAGTELHGKSAHCAFNPRSIVVPLDGSTDSEAALPMAIYLGGVFGVDIRVVHAIEGDGEGADAASAIAAFEGYVAELAGNGHLPARSVPEVSAGTAPETILAAAGPDDLVVLASHGRGGLKAALFGSVADKVVRGATSPTLVVPITHAATALPIKDVVIAVDESECAAHAAAIGRDFAARCGAAVTLVNSYLFTPVAAGMEAAYLPMDAVQAEQSAAEALVAEAAEPGEKQQAVLGPTVDAIAETASQLGAGLVVAGAKGHGFFGRLLMGSVSEGLMHRLDRPVLIVPASRE